MEWHTKYDYRVTAPGTDVSPAQAASLPELSALGITYHLLPDDGAPDAVDLITLQQGRP